MFVLCIRMICLILRACVSGFLALHVLWILHYKTFHSFIYRNFTELNVQDYSRWKSDAENYTSPHAHCFVSPVNNVLNNLRYRPADLARSSRRSNKRFNSCNTTPLGGARWSAVRRRAARRRRRQRQKVNSRSDCVRLGRAGQTQLPNLALVDDVR